MKKINLNNPLEIKKALAARKAARLKLNLLEKEILSLKELLEKEADLTGKNIIIENIFSPKTLIYRNNRGYWQITENYDYLTIENLKNKNSKTVNDFIKKIAEKIKIMTNTAEKTGLRIDLDNIFGKSFEYYPDNLMPDEIADQDEVFSPNRDLESGWKTSSDLC